MRLSREMMLRLWPKAIKDFASTITYYDAIYDTASKEEKSVAGAEDTLAAWLDEISHEDDEDGHHHDTHCINPRINSNSVELYRCTYCRNPSAALRKCSGCGKVRYGDRYVTFASMFDSHVQVLRCCLPEVPLVRAQGNL